MSKKKISPEKAEKLDTKTFFDCVLPGIIKFNVDHYIVGDSYRCAWAIREYPPLTEQQAIFARVADKNGVTLRIYHRLVEAAEQRKIIQNATRKNKMKSTANDMTDSVEAEGNLQDVIDLLAGLRKSRECLLHCAVFIELKAKSLESLRELQNETLMELARAKITVDRLTLRQKEGFLSVLPFGANQFGTLYERVLPASSAANFYPFAFSGKTDSNGFYIGKDKYGTNVIVDLDRRAEDKATSNVLILGNSGQGKSYLMKLLLTNIRESGKKVICLDPESEYEELCRNLGGCYIDFLSGEYKINPLEPKAWTETTGETSGKEENTENCPEAFKKVTRLSQHIAFLKDFFKAYKDFDDNAFLDSELEQILCFDTEIDAEKFCSEKSAIFIIMPEEAPTTFFMISLIIQQLYREILAVADEEGGKLKNRCIFFCDEFGTLPKIQDAEMIFSASRSRRLQIVPIIQSFSQLDKNYGKEGEEIIVDNTQLTIFGGFAPNSPSAEVLSKALGTRTVLTGSVNKGKNDPSESLQMTERPLMSADELKAMPKGQFVVMKTGAHPDRNLDKRVFRNV